MTKASRYILLVAFLAAQLSASSGCVTETTTVRESAGVRIFDPGEEKKHKLKPLGFVSGEAGGYVWMPCRERAQMSLDELLEQARKLGADAIGQVQWDATRDDIPGCQRKYLYGLTVFMLATPMMLNTRVEAMAYQVQDR